MDRIKNYYEILGVNEKANAEEIKKAYRTLAKKYHPDKSKDDKNAEERFKEISEAYSILSNSQERTRYDQLRNNPIFRQPDFRNGFDPFADYRNQGSGPRGSAKKRARDASFPDFSDILETFFGDSFSFHNSPFEDTSLLDINADLNLSFDQVLNGGKIVVSVGNSGKIRLNLKPGMKEGEKLKIKGRGKQDLFGKKKGDLYLRVKVTQHPIFKIKDLDLHAAITISMAQAVGGTTIKMNDAWNDTLKFKVPPQTSHGQLFAFKKRGIKRGDQQGNLYIRVNVQPGDDLKRQHEEIFKEQAKRKSYN